MHHNLQISYTINQTDDSVSISCIGAAKPNASGSGARLYHPVRNIRYTLPRNEWRAPWMILAHHHHHHSQFTPCRKFFLTVCHKEALPLLPLAAMFSWHCSRGNKVEGLATSKKPLLITAINLRVRWCRYSICHGITQTPFCRGMKACWVLVECSTGHFPMRFSP